MGVNAILTKCGENPELCQANHRVVSKLCCKLLHYDHQKNRLRHMKSFKKVKSQLDFKQFEGEAWYKEFLHIAWDLVRCGFCSKVEKEPNEFKKCAACKAEFYCSPECQKNDWDSHKPQCKPVV